MSEVLLVYKLEDRPQLFLEGVKQWYGYLTPSDPFQEDRGDLLIHQNFEHSPVVKRVRPILGDYTGRLFWSFCVILQNGTPPPHHRTLQSSRGNDSMKIALQLYHRAKRLSTIYIADSITDRPYRLKGLRP